MQRDTFWGVPRKNRAALSRIASLHGLGYLYTMLDSQKIPLARVKEAFVLTVQETENLVDALWPQHVLPWELWREAYARFWRSTAIDNAEVFGTNNPPFPEMTGIWADAPAYAWRDKMYGFLGEMVFALPAKSLQSGLEYILEETYGDSSNVFSEERKLLYASLEEAEKDVDWRFYPRTSAAHIDAMLNEKAFGNPKKSYNFIGQVIPDAMIVDKFLAVRHLILCGIPFVHEVKGITRHYVERVMNALLAEAPTSFSAATPRQVSASPKLDTDTPASDAENVIYVPEEYWKNKSWSGSLELLRRDGFPEFVIAYVLYEWIGPKNKTQIGCLLGDNEKKDAKSHRNLINALLDQAALAVILKA